MTGGAPLRVEIADGIAWLTLDRSAAGNAIDLPLARALDDAAIRCAGDAAVRCVVITGAGRLFCAGGDIQLMIAAGDALDTALAELAGTLHEALAKFAAMAKPLVVLVNGPAAGAGLSLAISGDIVLCARTAHFTAAYGMLGLTPDGGMTWTLPRLVGLRRAQEIILANRRIGAEEAHAIGMVTRLVDDDALLAEGRAVAEALARGPTAALGAARHLLHRSSAAGFESQLDDEARAIAAAGASADAREGLSAYLGKRPAIFEGQ